MADENTEDLRELHEESMQPLSVDEQAMSIDLSLSPSKIADDNRKDVILKVLEIHGVNHDTLNISRSKFDKMNKKQLVDALFSHIKGDKKSSNDDSYIQSNEQTLDNVIMQVLELKDVIMEARETNDYKKLDAIVSMNVLEQFSNDESMSNISVNSPYFTRFIIAIGIIYFIARMIGFDVISEQIIKLKQRVLGGISAGQQSSSQV